MVKRGLLCEYVLIVCGSACSQEPKVGQVAVALVSESADVTLVVFATADHDDELAQIANGEIPMTFRWISVEVPVAYAPAFETPEGFVVDLAQASVPTTFTQVYKDVCNPAADDFNPCWLFERYRAGDTGLTGGLQVRLAGEQAEGRFNLSWEGLTGRFGGQEQWHRHETSAGFVANVVGGQP